MNALVEVKLEIDDSALDAISESNKGDVIQIIREILSNIARHALANEVTLTCSLEEEQVAIAIKGDGVGFDPETVARGHGLTNIEERVKRLGGSIEVTPCSPKGMLHVISVPRMES